MKNLKPAVLIANRGEIAIRIARTCHILGFKTIGVYSDADRFAEHVKHCDEAYWIGASEPKESYLRIDRILDVAKRSQAKMIHPGYGFLSENAEFIKACDAAKIIFIGPSAQCVERMGDKIQARATVESLDIPGVPGSEGALKNKDEALKLAKKIGFPLLLKAKAGGGGKGMRRVDNEKNLIPAFEGAMREAQNAFSDSDIYIEKYILQPHHVEIQVFGDGKGKAIHLGERECSIQRRHQKIWEETPSPILDKFPQTREKMFSAAIKITESLKYSGAGTIEFIVDSKGGFYFLEMNTRLQVEHPVTEWVSGIDLVAWQVLLAQGDFKLPDSVKSNGHSIEVRIYAEDPKSFLPAPGEISKVTIPQGPFVRWDSSFTSEGNISIFYDPMIAKLSVWSPTRIDAISRMKQALDEVQIEAPRTENGEVKGSLQTNLTFLRKLVRNKLVIQGDTATDLIPSQPQLTEDDQEPVSHEAAIALSLYHLLSESKSLSIQKNIGISPWKAASRKEGMEF